MGDKRIFLISQNNPSLDRVRTSGTAHSILLFSNPAIFRMMDDPQKVDFQPVILGAPGQDAAPQTRFLDMHEMPR